jgi:hypothetical protein
MQAGSVSLTNSREKNRFSRLGKLKTNTVNTIGLKIAAVRHTTYKVSKMSLYDKVFKCYMTTLSIASNLRHR